MLKQKLSDSKLLQTFRFLFFHLMQKNQKKKRKSEGKNCDNKLLSWFREKRKDTLRWNLSGAWKLLTYLDFNRRRRRKSFLGKLSSFSRKLNYLKIEFRFQKVPAMLALRTSKPSCFKTRNWILLMMNNVAIFDGARPWVTWSFFHWKFWYHCKSNRRSQVSGKAFL